MKYHYYPGCSLQGTAMEYDLSTRAVLSTLGVDLQEIEDWTCCGASAAEATDALLALVLPARNLALAEQKDEQTDVLAPCSACYLNLKTVEEKKRQDPAVRKATNEVLQQQGLAFQGRLRVRHLLDVLSTDIGPQPIQDRVRVRLDQVTVAPYYGCQCLRPYAVFDDPERPTSMEPLIRATGANVLQWSMQARCCGASHMNTHYQVGLTLVADLLDAADHADAIVTVCPMCQLNLEAFQTAASRKRKKDLHIDILYLPQLIGVAMGLDPKQLGLHYNLSLSRRWRQLLRRVQPSENVACL